MAATVSLDSHLRGPGSIPVGTMVGNYSILVSLANFHSTDCSRFIVSILTASLNNQLKKFTCITKIHNQKLKYIFLASVFKYSRPFDKQKIYERVSNRNKYSLFIKNWMNLIYSSTNM
jgi:hypothetical protein